MARINRKELTRLELIRHAAKSFLENGYSSTSVKTICKELDMSPGLLTFHFPTKEHLLAALVELLCKFQGKMMEMEAQEGFNSQMAICLEFVIMVAMSEDDEIAKDFYISAYSSPMCLEIIRKNDAERAKSVFREYCQDWTHEQFEAAELLVSGTEYATLMTSGVQVSLESRIEGGLNNILRLYNVPEETRNVLIEKTLALNYRQNSNRIFDEFRKFVDQANEQAVIDLLIG